MSLFDFVGLASKSSQVMIELIGKELCHNFAVSLRVQGKSLNLKASLETQLYLIISQSSRKLEICKLGSS